jgi:uncharacterized membrane protein (UPF0182 family)
MEEDLDKALHGVLGEKIPTPPPALASPRIPETIDTYNLGSLALEHYNKAKEHLREGDWAAYGRELEQLENILKEMARIAQEKKE